MFGGGWPPTDRSDVKVVSPVSTGGPVGVRPTKRQKVGEEISPATDDDLTDRSDFEAEDVEYQHYVDDGERELVMHELEEAQKLRKGIVKAFAFKETDMLAKMVPRLERVKYAPELLRRSGLLWLVNCDRVWQVVNQTSHNRVKKIRKRWSERMPEAEKGIFPFNPMHDSNPDVFRIQVDRLFEWMNQRTKWSTDIWILKDAALYAVSLGCSSWKMLELVTEEELLTVMGKGVVFTFLLTMIGFANNDATKLKNRQVRKMLALQDEETMSALQIVDELSPESIADAEKEMENLMKMAGIDVAEQSKPASELKKMVQAVENGIDIREMARKRVKQLLLVSRQGSLGCTASALRSWHTWATKVFGYPPERSMPPVASGDVEEWVAMAFRNQGTAANYVSALKWACIRHRLSTDWWGDTLTKLFDSVKKMQVARMAGNLKVRALLDEVLVELAPLRADVPCASSAFHVFF